MLMKKKKKKKQQQQKQLNQSILKNIQQLNLLLYNFHTFILRIFFRVIARNGIEGNDDKKGLRGKLHSYKQLTITIESR